MTRARREEAGGAHPSAVGLWISLALLAGCPASERATARSSPDARASASPGPCLERPTALAPADPAPLDAGRARRALAAATAEAEAGRWTTAKAAYRDALAADPGLGLAHLGVAEALAYTGGSAEDRRDHLAAAIVDLPRNPRAHVRFADALAATGESQAALRHLRCALELKDGLRDARRRAAHLALETEGPEAAAALMAPLLGRSAEASDWVLAARVHEASGAPVEAAEAMEKAAHAARSAPLHRRAAELWAEAGDEERETHARRRAEALDPRPSRDLRDLRPSRVRKR